MKQTFSENNFNQENISSNQRKKQTRKEARNEKGDFNELIKWGRNRKTRTVIYLLFLFKDLHKSPGGNGIINGWLVSKKEEKIILINKQM